MSVPGTDIWLAVVDAFERLRGRKTRDLWLRDAVPVSFRRGLFTLEVANPSAKAAIDARYRDDLEALFRELTGSPVRVQTQAVERINGAVTSAGMGTSTGAGSGTSTGTGTGTENGTARRLPDAVTDHGVAPAWAERCVRSTSNQLAFDAVQRFVLAHDGGFNPLLVFGPAGTGKTELGRMALRKLTEAGEASHPLVVSGETLARDVYRAIRSKDMPALHRTWADCDLLLLDEAHRLRGQRRAQAELVTLMEHVRGRGGRILLLSRHAPQDIHGLDERLVSRWLSGMVVPVGEPDTADRNEVLAAVCATLDLPVDAGVAAAVAARCPGNLTDAVGLLGSLAAEAAARGGALDMERVRRRLDRALPGAAGMDALLDMACTATGVDVARIRSAEKAREVAAARHLVVYLATRSLGLSARQVCRHLGLRSPSVAAYARRQVERRRHNDEGFDRLVHSLQGRLEGAQRDLPW